ncbi:hypothetical protein C9374_004278 [Naegleria lovaniensis]|uniref:t-SNARE coiled-coil homology domain-containing protein n=1 Tax=Naegleria lovaniensis TaxID=51637 RepID=A0AA88GS73_NAELO|nr:uncharacterized protein C9374_004278 [Naegleria lovaniensis]KAG2383607.1 hypothetical protein C9374_004278 [Naegleria lovaniensis]
MLSRGAMQDCINRMVRVYEETSGQKLDGGENETDGLTPFDACKFLIAKKIMATRERKYDRDSKKNPKEDSTTSHLLQGADELDNENKNDGGMEGVVLEQNLPDDATKSQLPSIDISQAMLKVQDMQKQIDQGLDVFSKKLDDLHQMSLDIGSELNEQNRLLEQIDKKVEEEVTKLKNLNARVESALDKVGGSNKIMCIICIAIIIVQFVGEPIGKGAITPSPTLPSSSAKPTKNTKPSNAELNNSGKFLSLRTSISPLSLITLDPLQIPTDKKRIGRISSVPEDLVEEHPIIEKPPVVNIQPTKSNIDSELSTDTEDDKANEQIITFDLENDLMTINVVNKTECHLDTNTSSHHQETDNLQIKEMANPPLNEFTSILVNAIDELNTDTRRSQSVTTPDLISNNLNRFLRSESRLSELSINDKNMNATNLSW